MRRRSALAVLPKFCKSLCKQLKTSRWHMSHRHCLVGGQKNKIKACFVTQIPFSHKQPQGSGLSHLASFSRLSMCSQHVTLTVPSCSIWIAMLIIIIIINVSDTVTLAVLSLQNSAWLHCYGLKPH